MLKGIKYDMANGISKCFIAGTLISTVSGLVAIENIKAGDMVLSTDVKTGETGYKKVVETYVRETMKLVHLKVNGEEIVTTEGHPFYVKDIGFVNASELSEGDRLTDSDGKVMFIESVSTEIADEAVRVYNFQVEDMHTYYVSDECILVHNADGNYSSVNDIEDNTSSKIQIVESVPPNSDHPVNVYTDGKAQINTGKVDIYIRGKVELNVNEVNSKIKELEFIKKNNPDSFTKAMNSELKKCKDILHNYQRSQEMMLVLFSGHKKCDTL